MLVVNQKPKIIELTNEYSVFDQDGNRIGSVAEVGQSAVEEDRPLREQPRSVHDAHATRSATPTSSL